jgi:uncharacterized protein (DUF4415 family)
MELITILNRCHRFRGFVLPARPFSADKKSIEVAVRPRKGSAAVCSRCHLPASFGQEKQLAANGVRMRKATKHSKVKRTSGNGLTSKQKKELAALAALPDGQIDTSDIPERPPGAWKDAVRGRFYRPVKQPISMRLDADVVAWLKKRGKGYQTRVNSVLRQTLLTDIKRT